MIKAFTLEEDRAPLCFSSTHSSAEGDVRSECIVPQMCVALVVLLKPSDTPSRLYFLAHDLPSVQIAENVRISSTGGLMIVSSLSKSILYLTTLSQSMPTLAERDTKT